MIPIGVMFFHRLSPKKYSHYVYRGVSTNERNKS
jgi:hypothetical protein